jgi:hypothetical protein
VAGLEGALLVGDIGLVWAWVVGEGDERDAGRGCTKNVYDGYDYSFEHIASRSHAVAELYNAYVVASLWVDGITRE